MLHSWKAMGDIISPSLEWIYNFRHSLLCTLFVVTCNHLANNSTESPNWRSWCWPCTGVHVHHSQHWLTALWLMWTELLLRHYNKNLELFLFSQALSKVDCCYIYPHSWFKLMSQKELICKRSNLLFWCLLFIFPENLGDLGEPKHWQVRRRRRRDIANPDTDAEDLLGSIRQ